MINSLFSGNPVETLHPHVETLHPHVETLHATSLLIHRIWYDTRRASREDC
jgi:hypothetical protein